MGYGTTASSNRVFAKILGMKKGSDKLYFEIKKGDEIIAEANYIEGIITNIELGSYIYEEKERETYKLTLRDGKEEIQLGTARHSVSRSIINTLANAEDFTKPIKFSLYQKEYNGKIYNQVALRQGDVMLRWKYSIEEQKKYSKPIFIEDEYIKTDHKKWDAKLKEEIATIVTKLPKIDTTVVENSSDEIIGGAGQAESSDDEYPF